MKNTIDPDRPVELENGSPREITDVDRANDRIVVSGGIWYYISTGHFGGSTGNTDRLRLRNVGGRVRPHDQWRLRYRHRPPATAPATAPAPALEYSPNFSPNWQPHGGLCCGASHIRGFHCDPKEAASRVDGERTSGARSGKVQFKLALKNIRATRASGMVEAILKKDQKCNWEDVLMEAGFEKVASFTNSNTHNRLHVYHYYYGVSNEKKTTIKGVVANPFKGKI